MKILATFIFAVLAAVPAYGSERPCSNGTPCEISGANGGTYHLTYPENWDGKTLLKPLVFFHGHNGSGAAVARNRGMAREIGTNGFLLVAPDGPEFTFGKRTSRGWAARPEGEAPRGNRDDIAFVENVLSDVKSRVPVDLASTLVTGFSSGGSMAWFFGCYSSVPVAAIVSVAGGLRRPLPQTGIAQADGSTAIACPGGPRKLLHIHGFADRQVPLEGRGIRAWHQGDVFEGLSVQRHTNQCKSRPDRIETQGAFWCRTWDGCGSGKAISFCLHAGGHGMPAGWLEQTLRWASKP